MERRNDFRLIKMQNALDLLYMNGLLRRSTIGIEARLVGIKRGDGFWADEMGLEKYGSEHLEML